MEKKNYIKPKAYFIDIDGTLVSGHKDMQMNIDDKHAIRSAVKNETYIILSTGRSLPDLKKIWHMIDDGSDYTRYGVVNNGSGIWDLRNDKLLSEDYLDEISYRSIFEYVKQNNYAVKNSTEKVFYANKGLLSSVISKFSSSTTVSDKFEDAIYDKDAAKKLGIITHYNKRKVKRIANDIREKFKDVDVAISGPGLYIEVNKKGVSKGTAIEFMTQLLKIDKSETVHIGDSMNDAPGFEVAGYGVAMGNSMKELKKLSDFITLDRKKSGVANTLKSFGNAQV